VLEFATVDEVSTDTFLSVSSASPYQEQLREYLESLLEQGFTRPDWCIVGLETSEPVSRAAFWAMPGHNVPTDLVLIAVDWAEKDLSAGQALLARLHELACGLGADALAHSVDSPPGPPQYQENEDARIRLLEGSRYELLRDGLRWRYASPRLEAPESSLVFRPLPEVGEEAFVDAIAATYEGTRDSWLTQNIAEHGIRGTAQQDFVDYQEMDHQPEWWELAYTEEGELAGVVMAARNPSTAVIAYVGVVPAQRGRGHAPQLVRRGTKRLLAAGADEIRGDCDDDNIGMVKAFERAGYEQFARRRTYRRELGAPERTAP
jgi:ribosomal protein S18 acetylase RimI-like enzyme